ncbi:MAG TPA: hypothetical protein VK116_19375 [Planctomycetota bacterium]|nr:hypothetical protein [Planctomycetota bacterium]
MKNQDWSARIFVWMGVLGFLLFGTGIAVGVLVGLRLERAETDASSMVELDIVQNWILHNEGVLDQLVEEPSRRLQVQELLVAYRLQEKELRGELERLTSETHAELESILTLEERDRLALLRKRYEVPHLEKMTIIELAYLRREVGLTNQQQPAVYQILYEGFEEQRDKFRAIFEPGKRPSKEERDRARDEMRAIEDRKLERLAAHLSPTQLDAYRRILEERRKPPFEHRPPRNRGRDRDGERERGPGREREHRSGDDQTGVEILEEPHASSSEPAEAECEEETAPSDGSSMPNRNEPGKTRSADDRDRRDDAGVIASPAD